MNKYSRIIVSTDKLWLVTFCSFFALCSCDGNGNNQNTQYVLSPQSRSNNELDGLLSSEEKVRVEGFIGMSLGEILSVETLWLPFVLHETMEESKGNYSGAALYRTDTGRFVTLHFSNGTLVSFAKENSIKQLKSHGGDEFRPYVAKQKLKFQQHSDGTWGLGPDRKKGQESNRNNGTAPEAQVRSDVGTA
mgnify:CR=1 FL=1